MRVVDSLAPMHHGPLCLPPSALAPNLTHEEGLALAEDGYDEAIRFGLR